MPVSTLCVDVHAHILPGFQDGTDSIEHSISLLKNLADLGIRKVVATLHIMSGYYNNTIDSIQAAACMLETRLRRENVAIQIEAAAEYYVESNLLSLLRSNRQLLPFQGPTQKKYLLFDTGLIKAPVELEPVVNAIKDRGLIPVMAHPEQYVYLQKNPELIKELHHQGVLFQVNLTSLMSQPTREARLLAEWLIDQGLVSFLGSNLNHEAQLPYLQQARALPYYRKALESRALFHDF